MTINTQTPRIVYIGNGGRGPFSLQDGSGNPIRLRTATDLVLWRYSSTTDEVGEQLVYATDFTVTNTDPDAATFTLTSAQEVLTSSQRIVATREQSVAQNLSLSLGGNFGAVSDMAQRDIVAEQIQELRRDVDRAIKPSWRTTATPSLPIAPSTTKLLGHTSDDTLAHVEVATISPTSVVLGSDWDTALGLALGARWSAHLASGLPEIHVDDEVDATAQARINSADDTGAAGLAIVLEKTAAPTAAADNLSLGRSVLGAPGGSTYSPVSASDVTLLKATGSSTSLTLASNISAMSDYIPVTSVTGATAGMWVQVINPVASPVVARFFGAMIDYVDTTNNRLYLSQKTPWAMTTGSAPTIVLVSSPYENAKFDDIIVDGAGLTGEDAQGFALYIGRNVHVGRVEGKNLYGSRPWDRTVASISRAVDIFRIHGGYFQDLRASFCGGYNGGSINVNQSFNCHFDSIYSEDGLEDGPLIQNSKGVSINALRSLGTRSQHSARGFKFEGVDGFYLGYGVADKHLGTGPGFLFGSRGYVSYLETTRPGNIGDVVSATVTSNVATVTFNIPHRAEVDSVINFSGFSDANMNGDKTVTEIVGSFLTSTQLKFAVTTSDGAKTGTPVINNQNPTVWIASGKNRIHFGHLRIDGAGRNEGGDGSDIYVTTDDVVVIDVLETDTTPTYVGGGAAGTNYIVRGSIINGVWQPGLITHINRFSAANKFVYGSTSGVATEADITAGARTMLAAVTVSPVTPLTVATLPAGTAGQRSFVTDANATTFASIVAGGGANGVPVYHDGTNWRIG